MKIAHVINPYSSNEKENNIQRVTFESMIRAKTAAKSNIELLSIQDSNQTIEVPSQFTNLPNLTRSVLDIAEFKSKRALPLLKDILGSAINHTDADYLIFTNVDIGVQLNFYSRVSEFISQGNDAFIINRRRISEEFNSIDQLNEIYSDTGKLHNGFDCFVFKISLYSNFELGNICVGIPHIGNTLAFNMMCFADRFRLYTDLHLTFHIGYDLVKNWGDKEFYIHNKKEYLESIQKVKSHLNMKNVPGASFGLFKRHFKWLMNPNVHYPTLAKLDFKKSKHPRYPKTESTTASFEPNSKGYYEWLVKKIKLD